MVFPFFLFIVGVSIVLALSKRKSTNKSIYFKILKRSCILFSIGIVLALFPNFDFENLRVAGVLQRIALVYLFCSIIYLKSSNLIQVWLGIICLIVYWIFMTFVPFGDSIASIWIDQYIKMFKGFFSTIPATICFVAILF